MNLLQRVTEFLAHSSGSGSREIAKELGVDRREVNQVLYRGKGREFEHDDEFRWSVGAARGPASAAEGGAPSVAEAATPYLVETEPPPGAASEPGDLEALPLVVTTATPAEGSEQAASAQSRRPSPFGPAAALLPTGQQLLVIEADATAAKALERMAESDYGQVPVREDGRIIGVFSWQSFSRRVLQLQSAQRLRPSDLPIRDCLEAARFIPGEKYIDTGTDWSQLDYVLVGTEEEPIGILTLADVWGHLNDFAEAFVLIFEIERELRSMIRAVLGADLPAAIAAMSLPEGARPPADVDEFTFLQYRDLICHGRNWPKFQPILRSHRDIVRVDLEEVGRIRNDTAHFRRRVTNVDVDRLRRFLERLRLCPRAHYEGGQST